MLKVNTLYCAFAMLLCTSTMQAQKAMPEIRLNQVGFLPSASKIAVVKGVTGNTFEVKTADLTKTVFTGKLSKPAFWEASNETVSVADFSLFTKPGKYVVVADGNTKSFPFEIKNNVFTEFIKGSIRAFYMNRSGIELLPRYAGKFARPAGHSDDKVIVLPSAASASRPAGTVISTPKGWYDAGDYNKYIVNSGISTYTLLSAYIYYPALFDTLSLNIPESGNAIPDILDEALWNIRWMFTMQDPEDGGVYNKTTSPNFDAFALPHLSTGPRYVCAKGTAAALDFAAVMAVTARVYHKYLPTFSDSCIVKAKLAWDWAVAHPDVEYLNPKAEQGFPAIGTGSYGDKNFSDEFAWAATELYISTKEPKYKAAMKLDETKFDLPTWGGVSSLSLVSLVANKEHLYKDIDYKIVADKLESLTKPMVRYAQDSSAYKVSINYFEWGSNSFVANQGVLLASAYRLTGNKAYYQTALGAFDYLLGRNATNYCFISGFGSKSPMNLHHRPSAGDGIVEPIPGFLVGGPNPLNNDDCGGPQAYPSKYPAVCYADILCSYSTNEIAINWNAPLVFLAGAVQGDYATSLKK